MGKSNYVFTCESVAAGHPDKVCDRMSDQIVDLFLGLDPNARVACEALATTNQVVLAGETRSQVDIAADRIIEAARMAIKDIGYEQSGFDWRTVKILNLLHKQSDDIALGVDPGGAGDQGLMFGGAVRETPELMPAPIYYAHDILKRISDARKAGRLPLLGPDAKSQVTLRYVDGKPVEATAIVVSTQHDASIDAKTVRELVRPYVLASLPEGWMCGEENFHVNPTGRFVTGGPDGDAGLTGRKIIVDTYGGAFPHGGGAFSGKDPTKVDRSAAYVARYLAKNVVAAGIADRCLIQLAYAIGVDQPVSVYIKTDGDNDVDTARLSDVLQDLVNLTPAGIRQHLKLNRPIYARTAAYGHFGRKPDVDGGFSWEALDLVDELKRAF